MVTHLLRNDHYETTWQSVPTTLSDLERRNAMGSNFPSESLYHLTQKDHISRVTRWEEGQPRPHPKKAWHQRPQNCLFTYAFGMK